MTHPSLANKEVYVHPMDDTAVCMHCGRARLKHVIGRKASYPDFYIFRCPICNSEYEASPGEGAGYSGGCFFVPID